MAQYFSIILTSFLFLIIQGCNSSSEKEELSNADFVTITKDEIQLSIPNYMQPSHMNPHAILEYINKEKQILIFVNAESKDSIRKSMTQFDLEKNQKVLTYFVEVYTESVLAQIGEGLKGKKKSKEINELNVIQIDLSGNSIIQNEKAKMRLVFIENKNHIYIISLISRIKDFVRYEDTFNKVMESFKLKI